MVAISGGWMFKLWNSISKDKYGMHESGRAASVKQMDEMKGAKLQNWPL